MPKDHRVILQSLVRLFHKSNVITASCRSKSIKPCGSLRPLSEPSTTTPQKKTLLVTCASDVLFFVGFQSSPVASGTTFRGELLRAMALLRFIASGRRRVFEGNQRGTETGGR